MEVIKAALSAGTATASIVTDLQNLLNPEISPNAGSSKQPRPAARNAATSKTSVAQSGKRSTARTKKATPVAVHEDASNPLSGRDRYALATETVNSCLKILTDSLRSPNPPHFNGSSSPEKSSAASVGRDATPPPVLKPRSRNTTPGRPSPKDPSSVKRASSSSSASAKPGLSPHIAAVAECARLAFSFLRTADTHKLGVREMPKLQLETGILALVGKLIAHGLESQAVKELRLVKRRLETMATPPDATKNSSKSQPSANTAAEEKPTLASLLHLRVSFDSFPEVLPLAITYQLHVLKIIASARKPATIEEAIQYLSIETTSSPVDLILRQSRSLRDTAKAVKQLEAFSQTLLSLCPSTAPTADEAAINAQESPSPSAVLKLQVLALQTRKLWWRMANHQADLAKELLEPFLICANAFTRRFHGTISAEKAYALLERSLDGLGPFESTDVGQALFNVHNVLSSQAQRTGLLERALHWGDEMNRDCASLDANNARRLASLVRKTMLRIKSDSMDDSDTDLSSISNILQNSLTGVSLDYDLLLSNLAGLVRQLVSAGQPSIPPALRTQLLSLAAGFALRYSRSYDGKNTQHVQTIIDVALRHSKSADDLLAWVNEQAVKFFVQAGVLKAIADVASTRPLSEAWSTSSAAISLGRILHALILRALRSPSDDISTVPFDGETLPSDERGALLECQFQYTAELASRPKYHERLRKLLPDLVRGLSKTYTPAEFPIRRLRVALATLNLRESSPELLRPHVCSSWQAEFSIDPLILGNDIGLRSYLNDVQAGMKVAQAFSSGRPAMEDLKPSLREWKQIIDGSETRQTLHDRIDNPTMLAQQLRTIASYLCMLGEDAHALPVSRLLLKLRQLLDDDSSAICIALIDVGRQYLDFRYSESAGSLLSQAQKISDQEDVSSLAKFQCQVAYAEYLCAIDNMDKCHKVLEGAREARSQLPPEKVQRDSRRAYELLHARAWAIQSQCLLETGSPHDALASAKRSVRILNSIWSVLERSTGNSTPEPVGNESDTAERGISGLAKGIAKLQLTPSDDKRSTSNSEQSKKGAAFWPVVPLICKSLLHLSDVYIHHGLFNEANYYSERTINIAESVGSSILLSRIRNHRSRLLTLAGRLEAAELCLAQEPALDTQTASLALVDRYCSQAAIRGKEGSPEDAVALYEKAVHVVEELSSTAYIAKLEWLDQDSDHLDREMASPTQADQYQASGLQGHRKVGRKAAKKPVPRKRTCTSSTNAKPAAKTPAPSERNTDGCHSISKLKTGIVLQKAIVKLRLGHDVGAELTELGNMRLSTPELLRQRLVQHQSLMRGATAELEMDVTLNVLAESTLCLPAMVNLGARDSVPGEPRSNLMSTEGNATAATKAPDKKGKGSTRAEHKSAHLLEVARDCLLKGHAAGVQYCGTVQTHTECSMLSSTTMMLSAIADSQRREALHSTRASLAVELPRIKALDYEHNAVIVDIAAGDYHEPLTWPQGISNTPTDCVTAAEFQQQYMDIIPKTWTAVSLCLSEDEKELHIARYRSNQSPLILRLPFARHKPEGLEDEAFDYYQGKSELQEIIELSNYSCHNPGGLEAKGAKTKWWSEREALDRRVHELLINIENIWFGGFRSVFSQKPRQLELLARFRKSFEDILDRYLPSRKSTKDRKQRLALDSKVLELFIGLGDDQDGIVDLDEPLADLLYFVVDMLQFSGERNAYDEIDFDGMTVDVLDALRAYHEACVKEEVSDQHLILVLDRRLQVFPWESLPCLDGASVSRVGSMLSLRERIVAMRRSQQRTSSPNITDDSHIVPRANGSYILNPSSDLTATQKMLEPSLYSLTGADGSSWRSLIGKIPSEDYFTSALTSSSIMLYFGHGAGSQYIRPRAIKRLQQCSEVVWLMGCSSGAVSEHGELEPCAVPLAYLLAGQHDSRDIDANQQEDNSKCMAVVATLWDVTDKDIDRFSLAIGEEWGLWPEMEQQHKLPAKTPKKREAVAAPSTLQQVPKTPKTPKVWKTPAPAKTPARSQNRAPKHGGQKMSLVEAVAQSRDACYLRYLNGAAPVVYGIPVYLGD